MKLDNSFSREIKKQANGDGSREAKFAFLKKVKEANKTLSCPQAASLFDACVKKYGRVAVGICVAATVIERADRLSGRSYRWAMEVMKLYTNAPSDKIFAVIQDGLHPTRIEEYAGSFMRVTTEE